MNLSDAVITLRASPRRERDYDVLADGVVVGRIMKAAAVPVGQSWMWMLAYGHTSTGYGATRVGAMAAFAKSWRQG